MGPDEREENMSKVLVSMIFGLSSAAGANGAIQLALQASPATVAVGEGLGIDIYAFPSSGTTEQMLSYQVIFSWQTSHLQLTGFSVVEAPFHTTAGFFPDAYGINGLGLPSDGDALFAFLGPLGSSIPIAPTGQFLGRLLFNALVLSPVSGTPVNILPAAGAGGTTVVFGGPNLDVTGSLTGTTVRIIPSPAGASVLVIGSVLALQRRRR